MKALLIPFSAALLLSLNGVRADDKPISITEFAIADWSAKSSKDIAQSPEDVLRFMKQVLPKLERLDFVERYAWFHAPSDHPKLGSSALFDELGELTELGEFYASFGE